MKHGGETQGIVAADSHQATDTQPFQVLQDDGGAIQRVAIASELFPFGGREVGGGFGLLDAQRVGPRGVQDGTAGAVDGAGVLASKQADVGRVEVLRGVHVSQALPAAANADHLAVHLAGPVDHGLDDGVQPGDVPAAGEDADSGALSHTLVRPHPILKSRCGVGQASPSSVMKKPRGVIPRSPAHSSRRSWRRRAPPSSCPT